MSTIMLAGVKVTPIARDDLHRAIVRLVRDGRRAPILNVNAHAINLAQRSAAFRAALNRAPIVFCDGFGIRLGAWLLGYRTPARITYADWLDHLARLCVDQDLSMFLLGAQPGVADRAALKLCAAHPRLRIVGTQHGYFDKQSSENDAVIDRINAARPDLLLVGFGMPIQELWIDEHLDRLNVHVALSGGAAIDYAAGAVRRGPRWMTGYGLEWLARLLIEPQRLWRRYILGNPQFLLLIARQWWRTNARRQSV